MGTKCVGLFLLSLRVVGFLNLEAPFSLSSSCLYNKAALSLSRKTPLLVFLSSSCCRLSPNPESSRLGFDLMLPIRFLSCFRSRSVLKDFFGFFLSAAGLGLRDGDEGEEGLLVRGCTLSALFPRRPRSLCCLRDFLVLVGGATDERAVLAGEGMSQGSPLLGSYGTNWEVVMIVAGTSAAALGSVLRNSVGPGPNETVGGRACWRMSLPTSPSPMGSS